MFKPNFTITSAIARNLIEIESIRKEIAILPISTKVLASLRETARINAIHYSTMIEGNRLTEDEVIKTIKTDERIPGRDRDEKEVLGYYVALEKVEQLAREKKNITENDIKLLHALVMAGGKKRIKASAYRPGQNVIKDSSTRKIVYLPPEAADVPILMKNLVTWIGQARLELPCPLVAAIVHYQYVTIHPYYDGNGRTARLLTTLTLHLCGYDLKGIYSLDEYYAKDLAGYYNALTIGPSHNYYFGREEADITPWIEYFIKGMAESFEKVRLQTIKAEKKGEKDISQELRKLDPRQRSIITLFQKKEEITSQDIEKLFNIKPRTARDLANKWVNENFIIMSNPAKKTRKYKLSSNINKLLS